MHKKEFEKILPGSCRLPQAHEKVRNENETNKQLRKNDACVKILLMEEGVYRVHVKNSCHGYQQASSP